MFEHPSLPLQATLAALPSPSHFLEDVQGSIQKRLQRSPPLPILVILDDDPTGTQTCHDVAVLTGWEVETLVAEFRSTTTGFFILTNSRALPTSEARALIRNICQNIVEASKSTLKAFEVVLRGDSTLRGHFPDEPEVADEVFGQPDAWILAPFFLQGGRYTIDDVHYVADGDTLVPAGQTAFAKDATFGYKSSNLRDYVLEKASGKIGPGAIVSVSISDLRRGGPEKVTEMLMEFPRGAIVIVNAVVESDMDVFVLGVLHAEERGKKFLFRTGAAFVSARLGIKQIEPLSAKELDMNYSRNKSGGLIIAGSYVPKTTAQLKTLVERRGDELTTISLDVGDLLESPEVGEKLINRAVEYASKVIESGQDVLVMTSRKLVAGQDGASSLKIGSTVAAALVNFLQRLEIRPRYIIAKGGITSSDAATKGLNMKRALILGQAAPGVPLWRCDEKTARHCGVPFVVFPGNVGTDETLCDVVTRWHVQ
ncbi:MAG: hypothetical protein M1827_007331 [Pycnora praestabilis]|nr:MAG: hypothetical protein M1827_007331 [Pycnora praestabilis]